ncbi:MAG: acyl-CoA dehydrogenase family protein, partial [Gordonia sp. (in: high G+C Gram-positive bacteria)]
MTQSVATSGQPGIDDGLAAIRNAILAVAEHIAAEAVERERNDLSAEPRVRELAAAGLGRIRVPVEFGGGGGHISDLADVLITLAAADSNFVQIFRGHFGFIELLIDQEPDPVRDELLRAAGRGELFGPAASVHAAGTSGGPAPTTIIDSSTRLDTEGDQTFLSGTKYYTTGSLFADWIAALALTENGITEVVVNRNDPGVRVVDDWNGFGQRRTASGTTHFDRVPVRDGYAFPRSSGPIDNYLAAFYQFIHSTTQAGILRRATDDLAIFVQRRVRSYPLATDPSPRHDPQVLEVVGEVATAAYSTDAAVRALAAAFDRYNATSAATDLDAVLLASAATQVLNTRLSGEATWRLFDAASASATDSALALDRHWRNARTISSHNPVIYKARAIGEYTVNGAFPDAFAGVHA